MGHGEREPTSSGDDEFVCVRLSKAAKILMVSSSSIFLALAISKVVSLRSGGKSWGQQDGVPGGVFFVMTLLVILSALNQLGSLLSCYSNKPNKLWILSSACGHVIGFILVGKTIAFAELLQLAAQGGFVEWLYSAVVILLGFFFMYCSKVVAERKAERKAKVATNPNSRRCCSCSSCCREGNGAWDIRRSTRFVVAAGESCLDGVAILVSFVFKSLVIGIYDEKHMFAEHDPCGSAEHVKAAGNSSVGALRSQNEINEDGKKLGEALHSNQDGSKNATQKFIVFSVAWALLYFLVVPFSQVQLRKCRRRLPQELGSTRLDMLRGISKLLESSSVFLVAWLLLAILPIPAESFNLRAGEEARLVQNWIKVGILAIFSVFILSRRRLQSHWYRSLLQSVNEKVCCVIVGVSFEEALSCTFLEGQFGDAHPYLQPLFVFLAILLFAGSSKLFGDTVALKMELEIDEMLEQDNNGNDDGGDREEYMRLSRSIANEEELFSNGEAPYVKLLEGGRGTTTITTDIEEEEAWPGRH